MPKVLLIAPEKCTGCRTCEFVCPYGAVKVDPAKTKAVVAEVLCKGCGTCVAACPSGSIRQNLFEDDQINSEIDGVVNYG